MSAIVTKVRNHIKEQLSKVDEKLVPKIANAVKNESGYLKIEAEIIKMMQQENFTVAECLIHIESSL